MRIGQGWDIHRLEPGRKLVIGGVSIPSPAGSVAHSDGDVLIHAIIDAVLGAVSAGDIGTLFPDTDSRWKGADSLELLKIALSAAAERGYRPVNIDSTVILQTPKLRPHIAEMQRRLAETLSIDMNSVSVKAKTNEGIGETGAGRAVQAQAVVLMEKIDGA